MSRPISLTTPRTVAPAAAAAPIAVLVLQYIVARPDEDALREFLVVTGMIAVATATVFGVVIPRAVSRGGSPGIALTLSLLGLLFAAAYWSGLPPVLAIGGIVLARRSAAGALTRAATILGVLALLADIAVLVADAAGS